MRYVGGKGGLTVTLIAVWCVKGWGKTVGKSMKTQEFDVERFSLQELKDVDVTGEYQRKVWKLSALEKLRVSGYRTVAVTSKSIREL